VTYLNGTIRLLPEHRLFGRMHNLSVSVSALGIAFYHITKRLPELKHGDAADFRSQQFPVGVWLPTYDPMWLVTNNKTSEFTEVTFSHAAEAPQNIENPPSFLHVLTNMISPIFVEFFEAYRPWLNSKFKKVDQWPAIFNFGRVIRNAASHGGALDIRDLKTDVSWYNLRYTAADDKRAVIGPDLAFADLIILIFEISNELDKANAPLF
jgi:hypothetical protein